MVELVLLILCALAFYHHFGFPLILKGITKSNPVLPPKPDVWPKISLIVPAYNEAKTIRDKIHNCAWLDYPADKFELVIACDGCTDETYDAVMQTLEMDNVSNLNVRVINFQHNRGKVAVLNDVINRVDADLIALSDCSALISIDGLKRLACHFESPNMGVVGATYHFLNGQETSDDAYWSYQRSVKKGEAHFGSAMGMHGAFYAFRKDLFQNLPARTINDDFILPMQIVAQGYRSVYDDQIRSVETEITTEDMNWKRRVRISAGNLQQAITCFRLLSFKQPGIAFCFFSGKFLRAWMALILVMIFALTAWLSLDHLVYQVFLALQILGLSSAFLPDLGTGKIAKISKLLRYLVIGHLAGFVGTVRFFTGLEKGSWKRASLN